MAEPVTAILTGIALVKKSVDFIKSNINTAQDIGDIISHVDNALNGQQQAIKEREKSGADPFATENIAKEVINAKLAQEQLNEMKQLIDLRFGHGTWSYILELRKKRLDAKKQAIKEEKARRLKKRQEIEEYVKYGFIALATILFLGVAIGVTVKFFVSTSEPVYAHDIEYDDGTCLVYNPKWFMMCMNEGREFADTDLYLEYKKRQNQWVTEND
tara:strand:+ start:1143 stop:1787 length:645 start_codon:yes stop_codon:yes gene_type:complete